MKRHIILKALAVALIGTTVLQAQAQGIYVNKKGGETIEYPSALLDRVAPFVITTKNSELIKGATATLNYEKIADMKTARMSHQIFPSGNGFVVVGGHTTNFQLTKTAEIYQNGKWSDISISSPHDGGFSVILADGRVMVGGGFSSAEGVGQSKKTDIFDPSTQRFTTGPDMIVARAESKAVLLGNKVYVNGNWYADAKVMDCYNGTSFSSVGNMMGFSNPYIFACETTGSIWTWSMTGTKGETINFGKTSSGDEGLLFDEFIASSGQTGTYLFTLLATNIPLSLSDDVRMSNSYSPSLDGYFFLTKDNSGNYHLHRTKIQSDQINTFNLEIPTTYPGTNTAIDYRGSVFVNEAKEELYLIGSSGTSSNQTVYLISYNFIQGNWTIAKADGFSHNLMSGSWTMLNDGRLACTGGSIQNNFDPQKFAYIFTPPVAGATNTSEWEEYGVEVFKKDGSSDEYLEKDLKSITTYEEHFDERITQEIPEEYLKKIGVHMPIFNGNTPPNIEGTFNLSKNELVYNSTEDNTYVPGYIVMSQYVKFSNQNMKENTIEYQYEQITNKGELSSKSDLSAAKILGQGDNFTVFAISELTNTSDNSWSKMARLVSGTKTNDGIKNLYYGFVMLDKRDPNNNIMGIGQYRIFHDKDGLSEPVTWKSRQRAVWSTSSENSEEATTDPYNSMENVASPVISKSYKKEKLVK